MSAVAETAPPFRTRFARALSWRRWAWAAGISSLLPLTGVYNTLFDWSTSRFIGVVPWLLALGIITLLTVAIAEASAPPGPPSSTRYLVAIVVAALAAAALCAGFADAVGSAVDPPRPSIINQRSALGLPPPDPQVRYALFGGLNVLFYGLLVVLTYVRLQRVGLAARALSEAEIAREDAQRRIAASHLAMTRGTIDPSAVIARLEEIERAYDRDAAKADEMLDELIARLRASIPRLRNERVSRTTS